MLSRIRSFAVEVKEKVRNKIVNSSVESFLSVFGLEPNDEKCSRQQVYRLIATGSLALFSIIPLVFRMCQLSYYATKFIDYSFNRPTMLSGT